MSHTAKIDTKMKDPGALADACKELGLVPPTRETVTFYDGRQVEGLAVRLKGWRYPVVVDADGGVTYDDYNGAWGKPQHLTALKQHYSLAVIRRTMGRTHRIDSSVQADGSLRVVVSR